jgi:hypothetical protein
MGAELGLSYYMKNRKLGRVFASYRKELTGKAEKVEIS